MPLARAHCSMRCVVASFGLDRRRWGASSSGMISSYGHVAFGIVLRRRRLFSAHSR